jgi:hypothetical protein
MTTILNPYEMLPHFLLGINTILLKKFRGYSSSQSIMFRSCAILGDQHGRRVIPLATYTIHARGAITAIFLPTTGIIAGQNCMAIFIEVVGSCS